MTALLQARSRSIARLRTGKSKSVVAGYVSSALRAELRGGGSIACHCSRLDTYYNAVTPDDTGPSWQLRTEWTFPNLDPGDLCHDRIPGSPNPRRT